jgi:hypothetical protein
LESTAASFATLPETNRSGCHIIHIGGQRLGCPTRKASPLLTFRWHRGSRIPSYTCAIRLRAANLMQRGIADHVWQTEELLQSA